MSLPERTPDVIGYLPGLRTFRATPDALSATVARYDYLPDENIAEHLALNMTNTWVTMSGITVGATTNMSITTQQQLLAMFGYQLPTPPDEHESPTPGCECGFYAWYPWVESRFNGVTPLDADDCRAQYARPHPAAKDVITSWWRDAGSVSVNIPFLDRVQPYVVGVLDTYGKVVVHDHGVRAAKAKVRALVDPMSVATYAMPSKLDEWGGLLLQGMYAPTTAVAPQIANWLPKILEIAGERTYHLARKYRLDVIEFKDALALECEWDALRERIINNQSGETPG